MSLGTDGSPKSIDAAIRIDSKTALRQEVIALRAENQWLRQQLAAQQERIEELEAELKQYKNAPSSKQGGAGGSGGNNSSTDDNEGDDTDQEESAGGDHPPTHT